MAGNHRSGRRRIPITEHIENGTYRPSRHGPIPDAAEGEPVKPRSLTGAALAHWKRVVPDLVARGMAKAIDAPALEQLCELWALSVAVLKKLRKCPEDKDASLVYRGYVRDYNAIGKRFGLAYGDRKRLQVVAAPDRPSGVATRQRSV